MSTELATVDKSATSVVDLLEHAKAWLATAVEQTGPAEIAAAKAQIVTAATYAHELQLSKDIRMDAQEMVRRAEFALGKAIRKGQAEGTVRTRGETGVQWDRWNGLQRETTSSTKPASTDFAPHHELAGPNGIRAMSDGVEPEQFDEALAEAKAEGNPSRANVVRKVRDRKANDLATSAGHKPRAQKADLLEDLAAQGYSSRQMCKALDFSRDSQVRELAREFGIAIPADKTVGNTRRINSGQVVENTATALEGLVMGVELINYAEVDPNVASQWVDSLTESMRALNRFVRQIKEKTQ